MRKLPVLMLTVSMVLLSHRLFCQTNTFNPASAGFSGSNNTSIGYYSNCMVTFSGNSSLGSRSGYILENGENNLFMGFEAGKSNSSGRQNVFIGSRSGYSNSTGYYNTFAGSNSGYCNSSGIYNTSVGYNAGYSNSQGNGNTCLGYYSGYSRQGSYNVFIGYRSGHVSEQSPESDKLFIENTQASDPLIWGDFSDNVVSFFGNTGIGTRNIPDSLDLLVDGLVLAKQGYVMRTDFPDYVFEPGYDLWEIGEVKSFIETHGHLPGIASADEVEEAGMRVGEMQIQLLKKIEELTLYLIAIEKENLLMEQKINQLKNQKLN